MSKFTKGLMIYRYCFTQYFIDWRTAPLVRYIEAQRDLDAFKMWCQLLEVNDLNPADCEKLEIKQMPLRISDGTE